MLHVFKDEKAAKAKVKREALHLMQYEIIPHCSAEGTGVIVQFTVDDAEDYFEILRRGYSAKLKKV